MGDPRPEDHPDPGLIEGLEPDQLVATSSRPLPPRQLSAAAKIGFWTLRGFVLLITALVVYSFVVSLRGH
ncbi:MAG TPA: hypothetical protein VIZ17_02370 [Acetobacteraceae bacterium]